MSEEGRCASLIQKIAADDSIIARLRVQALLGNELLRDLPLERDAGKPRTTRPRARDQLFSSRFSSLKKRQSVPCAMIVLGAVKSRAHYNRQGEKLTELRDHSEYHSSVQGFSVASLITDCWLARDDMKSGEDTLCH